MFLDTMSPEAIVKEARRDTTAILNKRDLFINMHRREILFAKKFPVSFQIEWKSPLTHNQWHIIIACNNKKERENPDVYYYSTYETYRGAGIIFPVYNMRTEELVFSRYTGHFFSRYRTRHLVPNNLYTPGMDVIRHYVDHNSSYFYPQTDAEKRFTCCLTDGIALGICEKGLDTFRTFISHDMLFKIQERVLHSSIEHQRLLDDFINDKLPASYQEYNLQGRVGRVAGPEPAPKLSLDDVKDLLKNKPRIPLFSPPCGKIELED